MGRTLAGQGAGRVIQGEREEREINSTKVFEKAMGNHSYKLT